MGSGVSLALLLLSAVPAAPQSRGPAPACVDDVYEGFDSRLQITLIGALPISGDAITGFEISKGRPVVATPHRIMAVDGETLLTLPSLDPIHGLAVDDTGKVWIEFADSIKTFGQNSLVPAGRLSPGQRLFNSGAAVSLLSHTDKTLTRLGVGGPTGEMAPIAQIEGAVRTMSWNPAGLAAVVNETVLTWAPGRPSLTSLAADPAFARARDVVAIEPRRVVVALRGAVVLLTENRRLLVVAAKARIRWHDDALFVLDERSGLLWIARGLNQLGGTDDTAHAARLVQALAPNEPESHVKFQEAVRIVGCQAARRLRSAKPSR